MGLVSMAGAALKKPELGRMKPKLTNPESPDFSRGECQLCIISYSKNKVKGDLSRIRKVDEYRGNE